MLRVLAPLALLLLVAMPAHSAKDVPFQVVLWPDSAQPVLRFTFSKFKQVVGGVGKERGYITDTVAENLSKKPLGDVNLLLYAFDKAGTRIGDGNIHLANVGAGETVKFEMTIYLTGTPATLSVSKAAARGISVTVNSQPQGAMLKVDGQEVGTTPKIIDVSVGKHMLDFSKEGFGTGHFPLEMGPRDTSGGSISFELGTATHDTVELRDGSVLTGDLIAISGMEVQIRVGGNVQTFNRNQIKRIVLTQRDAAQ